MPEDYGIQERENLIDRCEDENQDHRFSVVAKIRIQEFHNALREQTLYFRFALAATSSSTAA
jgi:hypothetical protein